MWQIAHQAISSLQKTIFIFQTHSSQDMKYAFYFVGKQGCFIDAEISNVELFKSTLDQHPFIHHKGFRQAPVKISYQLPFHQIFWDTLGSFDHLMYLLSGRAKSEPSAPFSTLYYHILINWNVIKLFFEITFQCRTNLFTEVIRGLIVAHIHAGKKTGAAEEFVAWRLIYWSDTRGWYVMLFFF